MTLWNADPQAHGAPLLRAGATLPADWRRANQALMACPAAQPALTMAAILPPSPQTPNARQRLLVVRLGQGSELSWGEVSGKLLGNAAAVLLSPARVGHGEQGCLPNG